MAEQARRDRSRPVDTAILVADPDPLARATIVTILTNERGLKVVGQAETVQDAVDATTDERPAVILLAEWFPGPVNGLDAARELQRKAPGTKVVMLLLPQHPHDLVAGVKAGVDGYVVKDADMRALPSDIRRVLSGVTPMSSELSEELLTEVRDLTAGGPTSLTAREREVLSLVQQGMSNREVATALTIGVSTVKTHVHNLLRKLGCTRRVQLVKLDTSDTPYLSRGPSEEHP